jgi:hypothetical protein
MFATFRRLNAHFRTSRQALLSGFGLSVRAQPSALFRLGSRLAETIFLAFSQAAA